MTVRVRGMELPVDVKAEIEEFEWYKPKWKGDRLIACSPFRDENSPSFAVNFDNGTWIDSGGDGEYRKGNFVKLLAFLRGFSYEEAEDYLISLYSPQFGDLGKLELPSIDDWLGEKRNDKVFDRSELNPFAYSHPYLERRGIPQNVQRAFDVGYDPTTKSVVLVWHDMKGRIVSWKHRNVHNKFFWYVKGGQMIRNHLYGIHWVVKRGFKRIWIVESEIDALTLWSQGIPAVAIGTSYLSPEKKNIILKAGIEELVIATDNDKDGRKARRSIIEALSGLVRLEEVDWGGMKHKDINDARDELKQLNIVEIDVFGWVE
jgi:hypothetical protein